MTLNEVLIPVTIYLIVPTLGLLIFWLVVKRIKRKQIPAPPFIALFLLFFSYAGALIILLTEVFWKWSGLASIGSFYSIFIAPLVTGILAINIYKKRDQSIVHLYTFRASFIYSLTSTLVIISGYIFGWLTWSTIRTCSSSIASRISERSVFNWLTLISTSVLRTPPPAEDIRRYISNKKATDCKATNL